MSDWDFVGSNTKEYTHSFHTYPATMISHVARKIISKYGSEGMNLLDPYCGSGTSLVEARLAGLNAFGFDLNHMARKISTAKTFDYNIDELQFSVARLITQMEGLKLKGVIKSIKQSGFDSAVIRSWYRDKSIREISTLLDLIKDQNLGTNAEWFIKLTLSDCLREVAFQRNHEFKLYRIKKEERSNFYVPLFPIFIKKLKRNLKGMSEYHSELKSRNFLNSTKANVSNNNTVLTDKITEVPEIDIVVTSPPYGDSETTVAYAQFSWLSNVWLGLDVRNPGQLDRELMGGFTDKAIQELDCKNIDESISQIEMSDERRAREVYSFYRDYRLSIKHVSSLVKVGGFCCYVVGNRTVKGEFLRTDLFTKEEFEKFGFEHVETIIRALPNTRMTGLISPTGKKGVTAPTMKNEYIVICRKVKSI